MPGVGCLLFDEDFDLHWTGFLEFKRKVKAVIGLRLLQTTQNDMHASRPME